MFYDKKTLEEILPDCKFFNFPSDWSACGIKLWHAEFNKGDILIARRENETFGVLKKNLELVLDKASAILTTDKKDFDKYNLPIIETNNKGNSLYTIATYARDSFNGKVISVTGSCGKTTTTKFIYQILEDKGCQANLNGKNTRKGIAWNIASFDANKNFWLLETSLGGGLQHTTQMIKPHIAIVTNIAPVHMEDGMTLKNIANIKSRIFNSMDENCYAILYKNMNEFDTVENNAKKRNINIITYGTSDDADNQLLTIDGKNYFVIENNKYEVNIDAPKHILLNILASVLTGKLLNIPIEYSLQKLSNYELPEGRGNEIDINIDSDRKIKVINEAYNANFVSMCEVLNSYKNKQINKENRVLVLGEMKESGDNSKDYHLQLHNYIKEISPDRIFLCGELMKELYLNLKNDFNVIYCDNYTDLNNVIVPNLKNQDIILFKASHSVSLEKTIAYLEDIQKSDSN